MIKGMIHIHYRITSRWGPCTSVRVIIVHVEPKFYYVYSRRRYRKRRTFPHWHAAHTSVSLSWPPPLSRILKGGSTQNETSALSVDLVRWIGPLSKFQVDGRKRSAGSDAGCVVLYPACLTKAMPYFHCLDRYPSTHMYSPGGATSM